MNIFESIRDAVFDDSRAVPGDEFMSTSIELELEPSLCTELQLSTLAAENGHTPPATQSFTDAILQHKSCKHLSANRMQLPLCSAQPCGPGCCTLVDGTLSRVQAALGTQVVRPATIESDATSYAYSP